LTLLDALLDILDELGLGSNDIINLLAGRVSKVSPKIGMCFFNLQSSSQLGEIAQCW
jgi:hypothetical protein